jgi:hypothetical protein
MQMQLMMKDSWPVSMLQASETMNRGPRRRRKGKMLIISLARSTPKRVLMESPVHIVIVHRAGK